MAFSCKMCPPSARQPQVGLMEAPGQQSILPGALEVQQYTRVCSAGPGWAGTGSGNFHGAGKNLPRARARPHLPVMSNPVCPVGSQGLCAPPCHPPSLSPCKAEHWDGQNSPVAPGQGTLAQPGGSRQCFLGVVSGSPWLQHLLWSQRCQGCV